MSKIQDPHISQLLVYVFQVMQLTPLTASHAMQQWEKSTYFATRLTADHSKGDAAPCCRAQYRHYDTPLAMSVMC